MVLVTTRTGTVYSSFIPSAIPIERFRPKLGAYRELSRLRTLAEQLLGGGRRTQEGEDP